MRKRDGKWHRELTSVPTAHIGRKNCLMKRHATGVKGFASVEVSRPRRSKKRCGVGTRNVWDKRAQATVSTIPPFDSLKFGADYGSIVRVGEQGDKTVGGGQGKSTGTPLMVKSGDRPSVAEAWLRTVG